jgi:hypothetical protein
MTREDALHVVAMVLNDNRGNTLTEALCIGIRNTIEFYLNDLTRAEAAMSAVAEGVKNG